MGNKNKAIRKQMQILKKQNKKLIHDIVRIKDEINSITQDINQIDGECCRCCRDCRHYVAPQRQPFY